MAPNDDHKIRLIKPIVVYEVETARADGEPWAQTCITVAPQKARGEAMPPIVSQFGALDAKASTVSRVCPTLLPPTAYTQVPNVAAANPERGDAISRMGNHTMAPSNGLSPRRADDAIGYRTLSICTW